MERKRASKVYRWLWWSPLLTIPTLIVIYFNSPGYELFCSGGYEGCDWSLAHKADTVLGVLGSALWHLVLLKPARDEASAFVRWHGRQALALAGLRTMVPLIFALLFGDDFESLFFVPILIIIWIFGTVWGQSQANSGKCSLARWLGHDLDIPPKPTKYPSERQIGQEKTVEELIKVIRFSNDPSDRYKALKKLEDLGMVEKM